MIKQLGDSEGASLLARGAEADGPGSESNWTVPESVESDLVRPSSNAAEHPCTTDSVESSAAVLAQPWVVARLEAVFDAKTGPASAREMMVSLVQDQALKPADLDLIIASVGSGPKLTRSLLGWTNATVLDALAGRDDLTEETAQGIVDAAGTALWSKRALRKFEMSRTRDPAWRPFLGKLEFKTLTLRSRQVPWGDPVFKWKK